MKFERDGKYGWLRYHNEPLTIHIWYLEHDESYEYVIHLGDRVESQSGYPDESIAVEHAKGRAILLVRELLENITK